LAERMVRTTDPAEQATIREQIIRGFYGQRQNGASGNRDMAR
jgi:hypothetical protein